MSRQYSEHAPAAWQQPRVECLWTSETAAPGIHRVLPDGCIDLIYSVEDGHSRVDIIGAMTTFADVPAGAGHRILAVRFHPAGLSGFAPCGEWTDQSIELAAISPRDARWLKQQLDDAPTLQTMAGIVTGIVAKLPAPDAAQRAITHIATHHRQSRTAV